MTTANKQIDFIHSLNSESPDNVDLFDSTYTLTESQTLKLKSHYREHAEEVFIHFMTAFRILYSKYHFTNEPLSCKVILSEIITTQTGLKPFFAVRVDFPSFDKTQSSLISIFNETKKIFDDNQNLINSFSIINSSYRITLLTLNTETDQIELDCSIIIDKNTNITFKAPFGSPLSYVAHNSHHHFQNILQAFENTPTLGVDLIQMLSLIHI